MECPMILAGLNEERVRKIGFYLRHDPSLSLLYFRTLRTCNILADMITTEMNSIIQDQVYWNRIGTASPFEIYRIRLLMQGPSNFFTVLYGSVAGQVLENTGNEADEIEHHLSVLRAKMNDLSCLLASINDAAGYLKRSYLVSNNRHYLYLLCDTSKDSIADRKSSLPYSSSSSPDLTIDTSGITTTSSAGAPVTVSGAEVLAPLRQMCKEDINGCLDSLLQMLERFDSNTFTPPNIPTVSPRITTTIPQRRPSISHIASDEHLSPRMLRRKSLSSIHSNPSTPSNSTSYGCLASPRRGSLPPMMHHSDSAPLGRTVPPLGDDRVLEQPGAQTDISELDGAALTEEAMNEKLITILKIFNEIAPHDKTGHYPMGFSARSLRRPTNFDSYWIPNLALCSLVGVGLFYAVQAFRSGELQELVRYSWHSSIIKFKEHILEPVDKLAHELFDSKLKEGIIVTQEDLEQSYIALSRMLDDYYDSVLHHEEPDKAQQLQLLVDQARDAFLLKAQRAKDATATTAEAASAYADGTKESVAKLANFSDSKIVQSVDQFSSYIGELIKRGGDNPEPTMQAPRPTEVVTPGSSQSWWASFMHSRSSPSTDSTAAVAESAPGGGANANAGGVVSVNTGDAAIATATIDDATDAIPSTGPTDSVTGSKSLQPLDLSGMGALVKAPSPITTRTTGVTLGAGEGGAGTVASDGNISSDTYMYKKLTALDIVEMQTKSSLVMDELMKDYEKDLKHPIRGMVTGNLMRSMLIQLQKLKVFTEAAMLTMDQILASNELTIAATAALPAFMLMSVGLNVLRRAFTSKAPKPGEQTLCVRLAMVEVERSLQNVYSTSHTQGYADGEGGLALTHVVERSSANDMELDGSFVHTSVGRWDPAGAPSGSTQQHSGGGSGSHKPVPATIFEQDDDDNVSISTDPGELLPGGDGDGVVAEKVQHPTTLRAKGMLVFRIVTLHKALVALFLVQRPIVNVIMGGWKYALQTLRAMFSRSSTVGNMKQLLSWVKKDVNLKCAPGQPVSSIFSNDRDNNLTAVTLRMSGGNNSTEYRNLHRDLLELSAPFYEINGARKLATAARMRASYQCLAPPSY